jgi:hypothetical protein
MKPFFITLLMITIFSTKNFAQTSPAVADAEKVVIDNNKIKVTEFTSIPGGGVCGKNIHSHGAHFTVILIDAEVELTLPDGKKMIQKVPAGTSFWSEAETHAVKNVGKAPVRIQIIETKG